MIASVIHGIMIAVAIISVTDAFLKSITSRISKEHIGVILVSGALSLLTPFGFEFNVGDSTPATIENGQVVLHPHGLFCWEFSDNWFRVPDKINEVPSAVSPITDNPKVRRIRYSVKVEFLHRDTYYRLASHRQKYPGNIQTGISELVRFQLYEFNNAKSEVLADFYNPLDQNQRQRLLELIQRVVNPTLAQDGLEITDVSFEVE